jgi:hypothetical protein
MTPINAGKVLFAGLIAGLVANVVDLISTFVVLRADLQSNLERLHLDPGLVESPAVTAAWVLVDLLFGIVLVFAYAGMRPRFGPGPKTAVIAGTTLYTAITLVMFGLATTGFMTMPLFVSSSVCALASTLAASLVGAALYKE